MDERQLAGVLLAIGSAGFLLGAANPPLLQVWSAAQDAYLRLVHAHRAAWLATNLLFAGATVLTAAGLWLLPAAVGEPGVPLAQVAAAIYALAAALWLAALAFRLAVTPRVAADLLAGGSVDPAYGVLNAWAGGLFAAFTLLAGTSLGAIGAALLVGGSLPGFAGWFAIVIGAVVVAGYLRFGDMPPFVSYLPTGLLGIVVLLAAR